MGRYEGGANWKLEARKRKRDDDRKWDDTREERIGSWRDWQKGAKKEEIKDGKKKKKLKVLG